MILMILAPLIGVMGAILLSFGVWMIYPPGGLIWSWLVSRTLSLAGKTLRGGTD